MEPDHPWYTFYQTRDWYDMPTNIRDNDWSYTDTEAVQRKKYRERPGRFSIYPKDVEYMYDCTPEAARSLLNDVRESIGLSVSGPVTYYDLQTYTELDLQTILDFIMES
ncbi:hypothetical protein FAM09_02960 [Niastella caeni]|uniref:Uncharacterized protein n=1 Tax=Niastella caeni TaxID=2569763 RepID=A0A4S8HZ57_9BACT|nr:hypothetical protein [Niastella caeni]THU41093.1 hypothetical protein FAM09_02960 [Niastella caeni]